jgi:two-component system, NarL family, response regulator NreC
MSSISILLVDDHAVVRSGLHILLEREPDLAVVAEAGDGKAALELVARLAPDVLVIDLMMPGMSGLELTRQVCQHAPQTHVVVLSMHANALYVREALLAGAKAYVLKEAEVSELVQAVREAAQSRRYLSRALGEHQLESRYREIGTAVDDPYDLLTESERAVLKLAAQGHTSASIAGQLSLSIRTIETYRTNLLHKLDLKNTAELVRYAIRRGIIALD